MTTNRLVVFGRSGQVGSELARAALPEGWSVRSISRDEAALDGPAERIGSAIDHHAAGGDRVVVVNAAAYTAVDRAEAEAAAAFAANCDGPARIAEACAVRRLPFIHLSTDYVFDGTKAQPYGETDRVNPLGVYGASKEAGEAAIRKALRQHVILRTAWVYSPFGHNFLKTMLRLGAERPELGVVDDQHGCPTAAADIAAAIIKIAARLAAGESYGFGTFHYVGAGICTWYQFAEAIFSEAARFGRSIPRLRPITTAEYPTPARRPANSALDCTRIRDIYDVSSVPWRQSMVNCIDELFNNKR